MNPSVKVAAPGWNASTAPDWALVFNSDWPSLQIAFEMTITITASSPDTILIPHSLNYVPLAFAWVTYNDINYGRLSGSYCNIDKTNFYLNISGLSVPIGTIVTVCCYNIDISQEASYPLPTASAAKTAPDLSTFIKIVKQNPTRSMSSPNMNDFVLNSRCQSPAVLTVATQSGQYNETIADFPGSAIYYPLQTSYIPWVVGAQSSGDPGENGNYQYYDPTALYYDPTNNAMVLPYSAAEGGASLVVLRDPLFYPNVVRVVY